MVTRGARGSVKDDKDDMDSLSIKMDILTTKVENLTNKMVDLTTVVHQINNILLTTFKTDLTTNIKANLSELNNNIKQQLDCLSKDVGKQIIYTQIDWNKKLSQRKFSFYEAYRNRSLALIYEEAINESIPKVPKKFLRNSVPQQSAGEDDLRRELSIKETEHEIKRLRLVADLKSNYVSKIDNDMYEMIANSCTQDEVQLQTTKWKELVDKEEQRSQEIWNEKCKFFISDKHLLSLDSGTKNAFPQFRQKSFAEVTAGPRNRFAFRNKNRRFNYEEKRYHQGHISFQNFQRGFNGRNRYNNQSFNRQNRNRRFQNNRNNFESESTDAMMNDNNLLDVRDPFLE